MTTTCLRPGCDKPLNKGSKYCSNKCSAMDRKKSKSGLSIYKNVPDSVHRMILENAGENSDLVLREISLLLEEETESGTPVPPLMNKGLTLGDWTLSIDGRDYRPYEALSYEKIKDMLRCGAVKFALEMKIAGVAAPFRTDTGWVIHSPDQELSDVTEANLKRILPRMVMDILYSALAYGVSFQELVWERKSKYELGLTNSKSGTTSYVVSKVPNSVNPETVRSILRETDGTFNGFEQSPTSFNKTETIKVEKEAALVIPYNGRFRNLWGESFLLPIYPLWFWYEVVMRSMVRYMHRMATPVTVVKAPGKGKVNKPGTTTQVNPMVLGLAIAGNAANSNALVIPSDVDPETKQPLWDIFYLKADSPTQPFIDVLEFLTQSMLRAALSGDRAMTQPSDGDGSKLGEVHAAFTQLHNELILDQVIMFLNQYFMPLYSLYNKGQNGPPVFLETQGLDPVERDNMFKLMGIAGNSQVFQEFFYYVDWKRMAEANSVPVLSDEEVAAMKEKLNQEALDKQEAFQEVQAKFAPAQKPGGIKDQAKPPEKQANAKLEKTDLDHYYDYVGKILSGEPVPIMLTRDEIGLIAEHRGWDEETLKLFRKGEFDESLVKRDRGKFAKKNQDGSRFTSEQQKRLDEILSALDKMPEGEEKQALLAALTSAQTIISGRVKFDTAEDAVNSLIPIMTEMGIDGLQNINGVEVVDDLPIGVAGMYDTKANKIFMSNQLEDDLKNGNPMAIKVLAHELLHSNQEVNRPLLPGESHKIWQDEHEDLITDTSDSEELGNFRDSGEGLNDLMTYAAVSKVYNTPFTPQSQTVANYIINGKKDGFGNYTQYSDSWVAMASTFKDSPNGMYNFIKDAHDNGFDMPYQRNVYNQYGYSGNFPSPYFGGKESRPLRSSIGFDSLPGSSTPFKLNNLYTQFINEAMSYRPQQVAPSMNSGRS